MLCRYTAFSVCNRAGAAQKSARHSVLFPEPQRATRPEQPARRLPRAGGHEMGGQPLDLEQSQWTFGTGFPLIAWFGAQFVCASFDLIHVGPTGCITLSNLVCCLLLSAAAAWAGHAMVVANPSKRCVWATTLRRARRARKLGTLPRRRAATGSFSPRAKSARRRAKAPTRGEPRFGTAGARRRSCFGRTRFSRSWNAAQSSRSTRSKGTFGTSR